MVRYSVRTLAAALFVSAVVAGGAARADSDDDLKDLINDCGGKVDASDIDGCLERAREIAETSPSPYLQGLTARLERQAEASADTDTKHTDASTQTAGTSSVANPSSPKSQRPGYAVAVGGEWDDQKLKTDMNTSNLAGDDAPKEIDMTDDQAAPQEPGPHS